MHGTINIKFTGEHILFETAAEEVTVVEELELQGVS